MAVLIGDTACHGDASNWPVEARDLDCFYNPSLESPVLSLAELPNAGPADGSSNEVAKAEQPKDTDILCEAFAAWAILNAASLRKFLILTHNKPMARWQKWQHVSPLPPFLVDWRVMTTNQIIPQIEIIQGATDFFRKSNINKDHYTKWLAQGGASTPSSSALSPSESAAPALPVPSTGVSATHPSKPAAPPPTAPASTATPPQRPLNERAATWNTEAHKSATTGKAPPRAGPARRLSR